MDLIQSVFGSDNGDITAMQLCARATFLLAFGILCARIAGRRTFSSLSPLDIIVSLVVGANISRVMLGSAPFLPALAATLLLVILHRLLAMAARRWEGLGIILKGRPISLMHDGIVDSVALRRGQISEHDLHEGLRMEQIDRLEDVKLATLERGGKISVIPKERH